jgi:hypothetical protein
MHIVRDYFRRRANFVGTEFGGNGSLMLLLTPALAPREERLLTVRELRAWLG